MEKKEILQAVVIADNYNDSFKPFTDAKSMSLLHLANVPMLDYALNSLSRCGVEEVFICASSFIEQIREHVKYRIGMKCSWSAAMTVHVIGSEGCRTMGDAMRDLDARALIQGHFILMDANTITNAKLMNTLMKHKNHCKYDKGAVMTVVYKRISSKIRSANEVVIAKEAVSGRLLHQIRQNPHTKEKNLSFPLEVFMEHGSVLVAHNLTDPQIAICSPAVLPLFSDNFDFQTRDDFLVGVLVNEEMLDSRIYCEELSGYATHCSNWQSYKTVTNDIMNRCAYPLVPDMGILELRESYVIHKNCIYRHAKANLARTSSLKGDVVLAQCDIDEGTSMDSSVIGAGTKIGKNCVLKNAFIMENVQIGDNCKLVNCVIGNNAVIRDGVTIKECGIIGDNVELPEKVTVQKNYVQSDKPNDDYEEFEEIGPKAYLIKADIGIDEDDASDDDDDDEAEKPQLLCNRMHSLEDIYESSCFSSDSEDDEDDENEGYVQDDGQIFLGEVIDSMNRGYQEGNNPEYLILEINSSRYAYNVSLSEVNFYVAKAVFNLSSMASADEGSYLKEFNKVYTYIASVLKNYIRGADAQNDCLKAIYDCCLTGNQCLRKKLSQVLCKLYNEDILEDTAILKWYDGMMVEDEETVAWIEKELAKFIEWLQQDDDDDESDDD